MLVGGDMFLAAIATTLAQANQSEQRVFDIVLILLTSAAIALWYRETRRRALAESHVRLLASRQESGEDSERNAALFEQHKSMNDLQIAKLTAEVELLRTQVADRPVDRDRIEAAKEYHELMVEKTRLEMDALRLQIAEMRKRYEDWRIDD